jgi:hypothetical protein
VAQILQTASIVNDDEKLNRIDWELKFLKIYSGALFIKLPVI